MVRARSGQEYLLPKDTAVGLHWALRHWDPDIYSSPKEYRPTRFTVGAEENRGVPWSWMPFSGGTHKCSGYSLAILEIPVVMAYMLREAPRTPLHVESISVYMAMGPIRVRVGVRVRP